MSTNVGHKAAASCRSVLSALVSVWSVDLNLAALLLDIRGVCSCWQHLQLDLDQGPGCCLSNLSSLQPLLVRGWEDPTAKSSFAAVRSEGSSCLTAMKECQDQRSKPKSSVSHQLSAVLVKVRGDTVWMSRGSNRSTGLRANPSPNPNPNLSPSSSPNPNPNLLSSGWFQAGD